MPHMKSTKSTSAETTSAQTRSIQTGLNRPESTETKSTHTKSTQTESIKAETPKRCAACASVDNGSHIAPRPAPRPVPRPVQRSVQSIAERSTAKMAAAKTLLKLAAKLVVHAPNAYSAGPGRSDSYGEPGFQGSYRSSQPRIYRPPNLITAGASRAIWESSRPHACGLDELAVPVQRRAFAQG